MFAQTLDNEQRLKLTVSPKTRHNKPAPVDGPVEFESADETIAKIVRIGPNAVYVYPAVPGQSVGSTTINIDADVDLGEGTEHVTDTVDITFVSPKASQLGLANEGVDDIPDAEFPADNAGAGEAGGAGGSGTDGASSGAGAAGGNGGGSPDNGAAGSGGGGEPVTGGGTGGG